MISLLISRLVIVVFGFLYPAFSSYKAIKTKDIRLYVKWMMYWIVFALFMSLETFTDIFFSFWFPFYYELKIILVFWLLSPVTRGSSILYRRVIHPLFMRREEEIDELIARAKDQGYNVILEFGCKGVSLATTAIMNTAVKGSSGLLFQLKKSYSLNDLMNTEVMDRVNEIKRQSQSDYNRINVGMPLTKSDRTIFVEDNASTKKESRIIDQSFPSFGENEQNCITSTSSTESKNGRNFRQKKMEEPISTVSSTYPTSPSIPYSSSNPSFRQNPSISTHRASNSPAKDSNICNRRSNLKFVSNWQSFEGGPSYSSSSSSTNWNSKAIPRKAVSTPDLSARSGNQPLQADREPSKKLQSVEECLPHDSVENVDSSPAIRRRRRRKRAAPKPPEGWLANRSKLTSRRDDAKGETEIAQVPRIFVDESKNRTDVTRLRNFDDRCLKPRHAESMSNSAKQKRGHGSKLRQFLSRSRELLSQWKNGEYTDGDSHSTNSHSDNVAASSDDSFSTSSSVYNSTNL